MSVGEGITWSESLTTTPVVRVVVAVTVLTAEGRERQEQALETLDAGGVKQATKFGYFCPLCSLGPSSSSSSSCSLRCSRLALAPAAKVAVTVR